MKFNLSKKASIRGGGYYYSSTVVIVASISNCVVNAADEAGFMRFVHKTSWRAHASLKVNDTSKQEWYQEKQYSDSIYNVIANAIADCKMKRKEFNTKVKKDGIVEFDVKPDDLPNGYTAANWNAVVLWNFLAEAINNSLNTEVKDKFSKECIEAVGDRIEKRYKNNADLINKAVNDIKEYANALNLYTYLRDMLTQESGYSSNVKISRKVFADKAGIVQIKNSIVKDEENTIAGELDITYKCANAIAYRIKHNNQNRFVNLNKAMEITSEITGTEAVCKYIQMDSLNSLAEAYYESRKHLIPLIQALYGSSKLKAFINELTPKTDDTKEQLDMKQGNMAIAISKLSEEATLSLKEKSVDDGCLNALQRLEGKLVQVLMQSNGYKESKATNMIQEYITKKDVSHTLQRILWTLCNSGDKILGKNHAPYRFKIIHSHYSGRNEPEKMDRVAFEIENEQGKSISDQIDKQQQAKEIKEKKIEEETKENGKYIKYIKYIKYGTKAIDYPDVLVAMMNDDDIKQNKVACSETMTKRGENKKIKKYQLVATVNRDLDTGEVYAVTRKGEDQWVRVDTDDPIEFSKKSDNILRSVAIYETTN